MNGPEIGFTGEFYIPGKTNSRIEADHLARYRFAARYARGKDVLDIACGVGYGSEPLMAAGAASYKGVDINAASIAYATATYGASGVRFETGDITRYRDDAGYDLILSFETVEHIPFFREALTNLHALLKPGGELMVSSPNRPVTSPLARNLSDKPVNKFHTQEFTPGELADILVEVGFEVDRADLYGQRLRPFHLPFRSSRLRKLQSFVLGQPDSRGDPDVSRLGRKIPRYFLVRARKLASAADTRLG